MLTRVEADRLEIGLIFAGTLGSAAVIALHARGRSRDAYFLAFLGVILGGVVSVARVIGTATPVGAQP